LLWPQAARAAARAALYELQVRKSALNSDLHLKRSECFFYCMLAVRQKSILWGLATGAGVTALALGGYVYLGM
jgi:hypothetical protein